MIFGKLAVVHLCVSSGDVQSVIIVLKIIVTQSTEFWQYKAWIRAVFMHCSDQAKYFHFRIWIRFKQFQRTRHGRTPKRDHIVHQYKSIWLLSKDLYVEGFAVGLDGWPIFFRFGKSRLWYRLCSLNNRRHLPAQSCRNHMLRDDPGWPHRICLYRVTFGYRYQSSITNKVYYWLAGILLHDPIYCFLYPRCSATFYVFTKGLCLSL